ncbi:GAF and ANTAR domain-containing protein [Kribbella sp. NPDC054772]
MDRTVVVERLARLVAATDPDDRLPQQLCETCTELVGGQGGSITINTDDDTARVTLAATNQVAARLESLQDVLGEGPCREAYRQGEPVVTDLMDAVSTLWPEFTRSATETAGAITLYCFPIRPVGHLLGTYSVYTYGALREPDDLLQFLANVIGVALLRNVAAARLDGVLSARTVVYQATGMVSVQLDTSPENALTTLRAHAFTHNTTVDDIAQQIVDRELDFRPAEE